MKCGFEDKECSEKCKYIKTCARRTEDIEDRVKTDCILYHPEKQDCKGLRALYCFSGSCVFYKSSKEYNPDGTRKEKVYDKRR